MSTSLLSGALAPPESNHLLKQRLSKALLDFSSQLSSVKFSGALVQVWLPERGPDGSEVLTAQGLPYAVAGVDDLLALFRCVSVRYRFSPDVNKPALMGAIGRVYATLQPEMSTNVQKYDKHVYLRVTEAQRCRIHSTMVVPIFNHDSQDKPLAVFELAQSDTDLAFPMMLSWLQQCLRGVHLRTIDLDSMTIGSLCKWPPLGMQNSRGALQLARLTPATDTTLQLGGNDSKSVQIVEEETLPACSSAQGSGSWNKLGSTSSLVSQSSAGAAAPSRANPSALLNSFLSQTITTQQPAGKSGAAAVQGKGNQGGADTQPSKVFRQNSSGLMPTKSSSMERAKDGNGANPGQIKSPATGLTDQADQDDDDISSADADDDDDDDDEDGEEGGKSGRRNNRVGGGAGKRLRFEDLQSQFGQSLKEAAANLGICATTLKRACRRHGIRRWPRRQIAKLSKALTQMGYQTPPPELVKSAVTGQLNPKDAKQQKEQQQKEQQQQAAQAQAQARAQAQAQAQFQAMQQAQMHAAAMAAQQQASHHSSFMRMNNPTLASHLAGHNAVAAVLGTSTTTLFDLGGPMGSGMAGPSQYTMPNLHTNVPTTNGMTAGQNGLGGMNFLNFNGAPPGLMLNSGPMGHAHSSGLSAGMSLQQGSGSGLDFQLPNSDMSLLNGLSMPADFLDQLEQVPMSGSGLGNSGHGLLMFRASNGVQGPPSANMADVFNTTTTSMDQVLDMLGENSLDLPLIR